MIRSKTENSLRSLKVDVIDILQIHGIHTEGEVTDERALEALHKLIDQGKVRAAGVTTHSGQETVLRAVAETRVLQDGAGSVQLPLRHGRRGDGEGLRSG